jgi:multicomponent Na+:H+ antiporter subunit E
VYFILTFLILYAFWLLMSGFKIDVFHTTLAFISCGLVTLLSRDLLFQDKTKKNRLAEAVRVMCYIPWLIYQIVLAAIHVTSLALHPRMIDRIDPKIIRFKTTLKKDIALVTFANSITLTPGTITVRIVDGEYYVHAISKKVADELPGEMERRIARVYKEG